MLFLPIAARLADVNKLTAVCDKDLLYLACLRMMTMYQQYKLASVEIKHMGKNK
jgi:hypothetical protein